MSDRSLATEILLRREDIAYLLARGKRADEIRAELLPSYPGLTLHMVYHDIDFIHEHSGEYIALAFLPKFGSLFMQAVENLEMIRREAWRRYENGERELQESDGPEGRMTKIVIREGSSEWLKLAGSSSLALIKLAEKGPVSKELARVMVDYRRLKDQEQNIAVAHQP